MRRGKAVTVVELSAPPLRWARGAVTRPSVIYLTRPVPQPVRASRPTKRAILERDRRVCAYCGRPGATVDHVHPQHLCRAEARDAKHVENLCAPARSASAARAACRSGVRADVPPGLQASRAAPHPPRSDQQPAARVGRVPETNSASLIIGWRCFVFAIHSSGFAQLVLVRMMISGCSRVAASLEPLSSVSTIWASSIRTACAPASRSRWRIDVRVARRRKTSEYCRRRRRPDHPGSGDPANALRTSRPMPSDRCWQKRRRVICFASSTRGRPVARSPHSNRRARSTPHRG